MSGVEQHHMRLIKYICEVANWNQTQLAQRLGTSQQALNNRAKRGTLKLHQLRELMEVEGIEIPEFMLDNPEFRYSGKGAQEDSLQREIKELKERLVSAENREHKLMEMLHIALQK